MTPTPAISANANANDASGARQIEISRSIFDLDSKTDVSLRKIGTFTPVANMQEFVDRLSNNSERILEIVNEGLEEYSRKQLLSDSASPWLTVNDDGEIALDEAKQPVPFAGTPLPEEKAKSFAATVLNLAKMMFGYPDAKLPKGATKEQQEANRALKSTAKNAAIDMVLSNPAAVEALRK